MIPNKYHFIYGLQPNSEPFHLIYYLCLQSCITVNSPQEINFYYEYEPTGKYWSKIKNRLTLHQVTCKSSLNGYKLGYAHKADLLRLEIINARGGVYADIDTIFVNPLNKAYFTEEFVMGREDIPYPMYGLCNAFLMGRGNSKFGKLWYNGMQEVYNGSWNYHSVRYPKELSLLHSDSIKVVPQNVFFKHMWDDDGIASLFQKVDLDFSNCASFHLWEHVAWDDHLSSLTEEKIKTIDTTYNIVARNYL